MKTWINFLHIYQPPTQSPEVIEKVTKESYEKILYLLDTYPNWKVTINISGSLIELLIKNKREDIIERFKKHAQNKRIELVGSAMYHPILALLPESEIRKQIELNSEILKKYFGDAFVPRGFFIPEMAYSKKVAGIVSSLGFSYLILDSIHFPKKETYNPEIKYTIVDTNLKVIFRDRILSKTFPPEYIETNKEKMPDVLITAHDGELYGHWHQDDKGFYHKILTDTDFETKTISEYLNSLSLAAVIVELREASWESREEELEAGIPYALWNDPKNDIHKKLWNFAHTAIEAFDTHQDDININVAALSLHKGLASCAWWWASEKILGPFSPLTWNPTEIEKGLNMLLNTMRSLYSLSQEEHLKAEEESTELRNIIWKKHWTEIHKN